MYDILDARTTTSTFGTVQALLFASESCGYIPLLSFIIFRSSSTSMMLTVAVLYQAFITIDPQSLSLVTVTPFSVYRSGICQNHYATLVILSNHTHSCRHSFMSPLIHTATHSYRHLFIPPPIHTTTHSYRHSLLHPFSHNRSAYP